MSDVARDENIQDSNWETLKKHLGLLAAKGDEITHLIDQTDEESFKRDDGMICRVALRIIHFGRIAADIHSMFPRLDAIIQDGGDLQEYIAHEIRDIYSFHIYAEDVRPEAVWQDARTAIPRGTEEAKKSLASLGVTEARMERYVNSRMYSSDRVMAVIGYDSELADFILSEIFLRWHGLQMDDAPARPTFLALKAQADMLLPRDKNELEKLYVHYDSLGLFERFKTSCGVTSAEVTCIDTSNNFDAPDTKDENN